MKIKFRGLRTDGKGWVYGLPYYDAHGRIGITSYSNDFYHSSYTLIIPKTLGQYLGFKAKDVDVYDGDLLSHYGSKEGREIGYCGGFLSWKDKYGNFSVNVREVHDEYQMQVVGNVHEVGGNDGN